MEHPYRAAVGDDSVLDGYIAASTADVGDDDFLFASYGRNGELGALVYDPTDPEASRYNISGMSSFDNDLVAWSGNWVVAPSTVLVRRTPDLSLVRLRQFKGRLRPPFFICRCRLSEYPPLGNKAHGF
ncbi:MAG: hypothetical protein MZW92_61490 [Comamonadaceae bacterium]|nr:hypothetical protein [Comamonadaceae bacterium]